MAAPTGLTMRYGAFAAFALALACAHAPDEPVADAGVGPEAGALVSPPPGDDLRESVHVALGIPLSMDSSNDYLIDRRFWVASYNARRHGPNWVAWRIVSSDFGSVPRQDDFRPDTMLPPGFYQVRDTDYRSSGYDRGHLCPSADRSSTAEANSATFLMTNMQPQLPELNRGPWEGLESYTRELVRGGKEAHVVAGPVFGPSTMTIGAGIDVPAASFKVVVVLDPGQTTADVTTQTAVHAVVMPNQASVTGTKWTDHLVTVDEVERQTGYDLLKDVKDDVEVVIEMRAAIPRP